MLLVVSSHVQSNQGNARGIFNISATEMAQNLSTEFSNILINYLGADELTVRDKYELHILCIASADNNL